MTAHGKIDGKVQARGLFVADLDGTLLTDEKQVDSEDIQTLFRLQGLGYLTAIATGRSCFSIDKLLPGLMPIRSGGHLPLDYIIFSTGAGIMNYPGREIIKSELLSTTEVHSITAHLEYLGIDFMVHQPVPDTGNFLFRGHGGENSDFYTRLGLYKEFASPLSAMGINRFGGATEVLCILPEAGGHARAAEIARSLSLFSVVKATSPLDGKSVWVEIFSPAVSKGQAVQWLAQTKGIPRGQVCAIGNDYNDEDLLHWAGNSYIVRNSPPALHDQFPAVASNNEGGVSDAVTRWLGIQWADLCSAKN